MYLISVKTAKWTRGSMVTRTGDRWLWQAYACTGIISVKAWRALFSAKFHNFRGKGKRQKRGMHVIRKRISILMVYWYKVETCHSFRIACIHAIDHNYVIVMNCMDIMQLITVCARVIPGCLLSYDSCCKGKSARFLHRFPLHWILLCSRSRNNCCKLNHLFSIMRNH